MPTFILGFGYCKSLVTLTFLMMMRDCRLQEPGVNQPAGSARNPAPAPWACYDDRK